MSTAFRGIYNEGTKIKHYSACQCYYCSNYYSRKDKFDCNLDNCTGLPEYLYNFNAQSHLTFEENLKYRRDIPLAAYIDFETTAPTNECLDPKNRKMFAVTYVIIFAFHPELDIDRAIIGRSKKLTSLNCFTREQLDFKDNKTLLQLRDCALAAATKNSKIAISEMFTTTELKFVTDRLLKWFNKNLNRII